MNLEDRPFLEERFRSSPTDGLISCPKCASLSVRGSKPGWPYALAVLLSIVVFPFGLLGWIAPILVPRKPTRCPRCAYMWVV